MSEQDPIETYLDELLARLRGDPRTVRRILAEVEAHLRDAVDAGATPSEAVARFGEPRVVAAEHRAATALPWGDLVRQLAVAACFLVSLGLVAVGASGLVAAGMDAAFGPRFVAGDLPSVSYSPERCAELLEYAPGTTTCRAAAARHHTDEVEQYRIAVGVLGAIGLVAWWGLRRRHEGGALPVGIVSAIGATAFAVGALVSGVQALNGLEASTTAGLGEWLSGAAVAAVFALVFGARFVNDLRRPSAAVTPPLTSR